MIWLMALAQPQADLDKAAAHAFACVRAELGQSSPPPFLAGPAQGIFITIEAKGKVAACRGTLAPTQPSLDQEIRHAARHAVHHDPRWGPFRPKGRDYSITLTLVDRLSPLDRIDALLPQQGLVLTAQGRKGIVLPWEGRDPFTRLKWAYAKAKVPLGSNAALEVLFARRTRFP